jgi:hypothetical protein
MDAESPATFRTAFESWQLKVFAFPLVALAALAVVLLVQKPDYVSLLWKDPMGVKMLLVSVALVAVGSAVYLGGSLLVNRLAGESRGAGATLLQVGLAVAWVAFFVMPAAFTLMIGPAAIQIQRNLLQG